MNKVVTVQSMSVIIVALLRAIIFAVIGAVSGLMAVLQTNGNADTRSLVIGVVLGGGMAFVTRATEGLVDDTRAAVVPTATAVGDVIPGTKP